MFPFKPTPNHLLPAFLLAAAAAALPVQAQKVVVTPHGHQFQAGTNVDHAPLAVDPAEYRARFQFHARLEGGAPQPSHWEWSVVATDGQTPVPDGGTITEDGLYTPPVVSLSKFRTVKVRALDPGDRSRSGAALVVIRPHGSLSPVEKLLGKDWRGPRVEFLAGGGPGKVLSDSTIGEAAVFGHIHGKAVYAARLPWKGKELLEDQWLVVDQDHATKPTIRCVSGTGRVRTLVEYPASGADAPWLQMLGLKPWDGPEDGPWACFLFDATHHSIWKMDADGNLTWFSGRPLKKGEPLTSEDGSRDHASFAFFSSMVVDRKGTLYVCEKSDGKHHFRRIAPDGSVTTLAVSPYQDLRWMRGHEQEIYVPDLGCMELDEAAGTIHGMDAKWDNPSHIYAYSIKDNTFTVLSEVRGVRFALGSHRGLSVARGSERQLIAFDPRTGQGTPIFKDADQEHPQPGPFWGSVPGLPQAKCGSVGKGIGIDEYSMGRDGQICVVIGYKRLALLLPDWGAPALRPAAQPAAAREPGESKAAPKE